MSTSFCGFCPHCLGELRSVWLLGEGEWLLAVPPVELVHGGGGSCCQPFLDGAHGDVEAIFHRLQVCFAHWREQISGAACFDLASVFGGGLAHADADAHPVFSAERSGDGFDSVVPVCRATFGEPNGAQRKCQLVVEDDEVLVFELKLIEQGHDRKPAQVHEGLGLGEQDVVSCKLCPSGLGLAPPVGDRNVGESGDAIDGHEACVVRRVQVFEAGIAETDDELHCYFLASGFASPSAVSCLPFLTTSGSVGVSAATTASGSASALT